MYRNPDENVTYEFVVAPAGAKVSTKVNYDIEIVKPNGDPLHAINSKNINSFQKEFREFTSVLVDESKGDFSVPKFGWVPKATKFFLRKCLDRKEKFRKPKVDKGVWIEILEEMNSSGFNVDNKEILYQKWKNLKRNYRIYNDKLKMSKGTERITWPYFHILKELFPNGFIHNTRRRVSVSEDSAEEETVDNSTSSTVGTSNDTKKVKRTSTLQCLRNKQQRIKEKKEEMAEKMLETLEETNRLQEERNNLILELIDLRNATGPTKLQNQIYHVGDIINHKKIVKFK